MTGDVQHRLLIASWRALKLLENIGTGKWAQTPAGIELRDAVDAADRQDSLVLLDLKREVSR